MLKGYICCLPVCVCVCEGGPPRARADLRGRRSYRLEIYSRKSPWRVPPRCTPRPLTPQHSIRMALTPLRRAATRYPPFRAAIYIAAADDDDEEEDDNNKRVLCYQREPIQDTAPRVTRCSPHRRAEKCP